MSVAPGPETETLGPIDDADREKEAKLEKEWQKQKGLLDYFVSRVYPYFELDFSHISSEKKQITLSYKGDGLRDIDGNLIRFSRDFVLDLPASSEERVEFFREGSKLDVENLGALLKGLSEELKSLIKTPARKEMESLVQGSLAQIRSDQNLDNVIATFRAKYGPKDLKLQSLLGLTTEIKPRGFSGGLIGPKPIRITVLKNSGEIGLVVSGGKRKNPKIFYSLESNKRIEIKDE